jgi:hypothetical protein
MTGSCRWCLLNVHIVEFTVTSAVSWCNKVNCIMSAAFVGFVLSHISCIAFLFFHNQMRSQCSEAEKQLQVAHEALTQLQPVMESVKSQQELSTTLKKDILELQYGKESLERASQQLTSTLADMRMDVDILTQQRATLLEQITSGVAEFKTQQQTASDVLALQERVQEQLRELERLGALVSQQDAQLASSGTARGVACAFGAK